MLIQNNFEASTGKQFICLKLQQLVRKGMLLLSTLMSDFHSYSFILDPTLKVCKQN